VDIRDHPLIDVAETGAISLLLENTAERLPRCRLIGRNSKRNQQQLMRETGRDADFAPELDHFW